MTYLSANIEKEGAVLEKAKVYFTDFRTDLMS